ncbi:MAG: hypothetical protein MUO54_01125 [Anaerolineales bacterium]|nr:hypothetical protein [Anaerolineales bacterium]
MNGNIKPNRIFRLSPPLILVICTLILLSLACNIPITANQTTSNQDQPVGFVETSIVETMVALADEDVQSDPGQDTAPDSAQDNAPEPATATATPENTETPTLTPTVTETPTPEVAMVFVSENTNCRKGPGTAYAWLVTAQKGEVAEAVARDPLGEYWYIHQPGTEGAFCWLWGKYATPTGPTDSLPVYTPEPTPTPGFDFSIKYNKLIGPCGGNWATLYQINNIGAFTLESWKTTVQDHTGGSNPTDTKYDSFYELSAACVTVNQQVDLTPGESYYLFAFFNNSPQGHDITTKIRICTKNNLGGECLVKTYRHTP